MKTNDAGTHHDQDTAQPLQTGGTLVPVTPPQTGERAYGLMRPDPSFVTHLIATANQMPQTRTLRRASPEDAQTSYRSVVDQNGPRPTSTVLGTSRVA